MTCRRIALAAVLALWPGRAAASPLFELVGAAQGDGGLNARTTGAGAASAYFNPALLCDAERGLTLGTFVLADQIGVTLDARSDSPACAGGACDVPEVFGAGPESFRHEDGSELENPTLPTSWLEQGRAEQGFPARPRQGDGSGHHVRAYQTIGLVSPVFGPRLVLGMFAMIPLSEFTAARSFYNDEREQFFSNSLHPELYSDRLTATSLAFGAGSRVRHDLALGLSFTLNLTNSAAVPVYVSDLNDLDTLLLDSDVGVHASVSPHFGAAWDPLPALRLTATVHTPQSFHINTGFDYILASGTQQGTTIEFTHAYEPLALAAGAVYRLGGLDLVGTATWARWSQYRDRHSERPAGDYAWSDTFSGSAGVRLAFGALGARVDATYQPTPVPAQTGRSNYVDSDRIGLAGGVAYEFCLWGSRFRAGASLQAHRLVDRHVSKLLPGAGGSPELVADEVPDDAVALGRPVPGREGLQTNNPGFPGFASAGWIAGGGLDLGILY